MRILVASLILLISSHVLAAPPNLIGGRYAFHSQSSCEARFNATAATNFVRATAGGNVTGPGIVTMDPADSGLHSAEIGYITFTAGPSAYSGSFVMSQRTEVEGGALRINNTGTATRVRSGDITGTFTVTETQLRLTIAGQPGTLVFSMVHSNAGRNVYLIMRENARCFSSLIATR